jgi:ATP phosphoribosyltransferase regulatory subunit
VPELASGAWPVVDVESLLGALDGKDWGALDTPDRTPYRALLEAAGPADTALPRLARIAPELTARLSALAAALPGVRITIDPTERHGFEYHSWVGVSLFGSVGGTPLRSEIGRGGAYRVRHPDGTDERAAGVSLYVDMLVDAGLGGAQRRRIFLPEGTSSDIAVRLRAEGWATVQALSPLDSDEGCSHVWNGRDVLAKG